MLEVNENTEQSINSAEQPKMFTEKEIRTIAMDEAEKKDRRNQRILQGILLMIIAILLGFTIVFFLLNVEMMANATGFIRPFLFGSHG